jgi:HTH-type transcriptional regulator/antitoxin HigA
MTTQHHVHFFDIDQRGPTPFAGKGLEFDTDDNLSSSFLSKLEAGVSSSQKNLPDPIDVIKQVMERRDLTNHDLKPYIGSSGNVCDILKRRRQLSLAMIRKLHMGLGIPAKILIQEYQPKRT